jgi:DNA polymerase-3 subunit delta'
VNGRTFANTRGHEQPKGILRRSFETGRVHHAYLFSGPEGVGKRRLAEAFAALLNCEAPSDGDACGTCTSCSKLVTGSHPDVITIAPDGRYLKIDQVRDLQARTNFRPYEGKRRVVIIDHAETLRDEAANALLKTLEEPRGDTLFVLVTSSPHKLLTTIRSRCQPLRFGRLSTDEVANVLMSTGVAADAAEQAARLSDGSVTEATGLIERGLLALHGDLAARLGRLSDASTSAILDWAEELAKSPDSLRDVIAVTRTVFRDAALLSAGASPERVLLRESSESLRAMARGRTPVELVASVQRVDEAERMLDGNVNARMVCESLLLTLATAPTKPLASRVPR